MPATSAYGRSGSSAGRRTAVVGAAGLALVAGLLAGCSATSSADPAAGADPGSGIGAWPTFLPSPTEQGIPEGSLGSPAMSYPGSPVVLHVGTAQALWDVEGPSYPPETKVGAEQVRCTFTIKVSEVSAPVSMRTASFDVLDSRGGLHALAAAPHHTVPSRLEPGHDYTLTLVGVVPAGEGLLRYYPTTEGAVAAWDYVAETD